VRITELVRQDHREINSLLDRLERPPGQAGYDHEGRRYLFDRLVSVASRHEAAEELVLWPQVRRRLPGGSAVADSALQAEGDLKAVLDMARAARSDAEIGEACRQLRIMAGDHAEFEEQVVIPQMQKHSTRVWDVMAGLRYRVVRRVGPTRPHPGGPDRPLGLATAGAPAMVMDHLRDLKRRPGRGGAGSTRPDGPDAVAVLTGDHERIQRLLARIDEQPDPDDALVREAIRELSVHDAIERQHLYPVVRLRLLDGGRQYDHLLSEHGRITEVAADLDVYPYRDQAWRGWLAELARLARTHMESEEATILPALAARLTVEELAELGARLERARSKAPTRPHRHAVGAGRAARMTARLVGPVDRTRDRWRRRRPRSYQRAESVPGASSGT